MNTLKRRHFISQISLAAAGITFSSKLNAASILLTKPFLIEEFVTTETSYGKIKGYELKVLIFLRAFPMQGKRLGIEDSDVRINYRHGQV